MSDDLQTLKDTAYEHLEDELYEEVLELLKDREELSLRILRVEARIGLEEYEEAQDDLYEFSFDFDNPGEDPTPWVLKGLLHYYLDENDVAREAFDQALVIEPDHIRSLLGRAMLNRDVEFFRAAELDLDYAIHTLDEMEERDDEDQAFHGEAYNLRAGFALEDGNFERAEADLKKAHEVHPDDAEYPLDLARLLSIQGRVEDATEFAKAAVEIDEYLIEARLFLSQLQGLSGHSEEAVKTALAAVEEDPEEPFSYIQLAAAYTLTGNFDKAIESADKAIELDDEIADSYQLKAAALQSLGRTDEIDAKLQEFMAEAPDLPDFLYGDRINPYEQAEDTLQEISEMDQSEIKALTEEMFQQMGLPEALRPMVEQMMGNLPALMEQFPGLAEGKLPPGMEAMASSAGFNPAALLGNMGNTEGE